MDKKRPSNPLVPDDMKGFEDFIEGEPDRSFMGKPVPNPNKKEHTFENLTFLSNDAARLLKIKNLLTEKLPFTTQHEQGKQLIKEQNHDIKEIKDRIFTISDKRNSPYRKSLSEIFDSFFRPTEG